ncbi:MAG TPA: hypothetical protein VLB80_00470 [Candidatus Babeliales bacterium]|nr:hypothetical protein [Candidatus Babeliales bacterium]
MNKKNISFYIFTLLFFYSYAYSMDSTTPTEDDKAKQQQWIQFKRKKKLGTFHVLPDEVIEHHIITPHFIEPLTANIKHQFLLSKSETNPFQIISYEKPNPKAFCRHDGTYQIVPDIAHYKEWNSYNDYTNKTSTRDLKELCKQTNKLQSYITLLRSSKNQNLFTIKVTINKESFEKDITYTKDKTINHFVFSNDLKWVVFGSSNKNLCSIEYCNMPPFDHAQGGHVIKNINKINALCSAHHSPSFAICGDNDTISLLQISNLSVTTIKTTAPSFTSIQFSPNDKQLLAQGEYELAVVNIHNCGNHAVNATYSTVSNTKTFSSIIKKASFAPDSKAIIVGLTNGQIILWNLISHDIIPFHRWYTKNIHGIGYKKPFILWNEKNNLLLIFKFPNKLIISDSSTYKKLTTYTLDFNNPTAMGLTEDENTIVFVDENDEVYKLNLYTEEEINDIEFITTKANIYQLCELWNIYKTIPKDSAKKTKDIISL